MIVRYLKIYEAAHNISAVEDFLPGQRVHREIVKLSERLKFLTVSQKRYGMFTQLMSVYIYKLFIKSLYRVIVFGNLPMNQ
jgi:hypothetical protein